MNCAQPEMLLHALVDNELDAGHAHDVEAHVAACPACAAKLGDLRTMRGVIAAADLKERAPVSLRNRVEAALPASPGTAFPAWLPLPSRRGFFGGFALGAALSSALAASLVLTVFHNGQESTIAGEVVSAHIRSLQPGHLTDVLTSDQHTVKPWFNGRLDVAPPVVDLTGQGFTLIGGRLDYIDGEPVAAIVYQRRKHVINLFVAHHLDGRAPAVAAMIQGYNVRHWFAAGLDLWAVSDIDRTELDEFDQKVTAALQPAAGAS